MSVFSQAMETSIATRMRSTWSRPTNVSQSGNEGVDLPAIQRITIKHPGYPRNNTLLALPACDSRDGGRAHYSTIHTVCTIIANNAPNGWLSSSPTGEPHTLPDADGLVPAGVYFFHVASDAPPNEAAESDPYPIVPNFRAWSFPHGRVPVLWRHAADHATASSAQSYTHPTTETCRFTNMRLACETSHILPTAEKIWFAENVMHEYVQVGGRLGEDVADSPSNLLRLRRDVHFLWDNLYFSIVPKYLGNGNVTAAWHAHSMSEDREVYDHIHDIPTQPLAGRAPEYMYARFAWDIFPKLIGLLQSGQPLRLAVRQGNGEVVIKSYTPEECRRFAEGQGRSRSASPTKRSRNESSYPPANDDEDAHSECGDSAVSDMSHHNLCLPKTEQFEPCPWRVDESDEEERRGRKRRRSSPRSSSWRSGMTVVS